MRSAAVGAAAFPEADAVVEAAVFAEAEGRAEGEDGAALPVGGGAPFGR